MIDDEVREVGLPAGAEHRLIVNRQQLLDQDENHGRAEQVEDEPVEANVGRVVGEVKRQHAKHAQKREREGDDAGDLAAPGFEPAFLMQDGGGFFERFDWFHAGREG